MKLNFGLGLPTATWFPDCLGDGIEDETVDSLKNGYGSIFFYAEDYINYTAIVDGIYIISGYEKDIKIGDWLVQLTIFGSIRNIKAIDCEYIDNVKIISEAHSLGPDGLEVIICYHNKFGGKKLT